MLRSIILPLTAIALLPACQPTITTQEQVKTVVFHTVGKVSAQPDLATFSVNLNYLHKSPKISRDSLLSKSNRFHAQLAKYGVESKDVVTTYINQRKEYKWERNTQKFIGINSSISHTVTVRNVTQLGALYAEMLEDGHINPGALMFSHSKQDSLECVAYQEALAQADRQVEALLAKLPESHKQVLRIGDQFLGSVVMTDGLNKHHEDKELAYEANGDFAPMESKIQVYNGDVEVQRRLVVEYKLLD